MLELSKIARKFSALLPEHGTQSINLSIIRRETNGKCNQGKCWSSQKLPENFQRCCPNMAPNQSICPLSEERPMENAIKENVEALKNCRKIFIAVAQTWHPTVFLQLLQSQRQGSPP